MAKVIFMHFDEKLDGIYDAKIGEPIVKLAKDKGLSIGDSCTDYKNCLISVEHIAEEEPTNYTENEELDILMDLGAISAQEAIQCQQYTISPRVRIAPMMLVKGDVLVKPYKLKS